MDVSDQSDQLDKIKKLSSYQSLNTCNDTLGADFTFHRYEKDKAQVLDLVYHHPDILVSTLWQPDGPLAIDTNCLCKMGAGDIRSKFSCIQCKTLSRLIDFRLGYTEEPFLVQCGHYTGRKLAMANSFTSGPYIRWNTTAPHLYQLYTSKYRKSIQCGTPYLPDLQAIEADPFTIRTIILWTIYDLFKEHSLPHCPKLYTAFICGSNAYSLYDVPTIGSFSKLLQTYTIDKKLIKGLILQLLVIATELRKIHFSHGMPSINSMTFDKTTISYLYNGVKIVSPVTMKLADMWHSSAVINGVHYFSPDIKSEIYSERSMYIPEIQTMNLPTAYCAAYNSDLPCPSTKECGKINSLCTVNDSETYYRLSENNMETYNAIRHMGFPIYSGSFDLYCWIVSLMLNNEVFTTVINDPYLNRIWMSMWTRQDMDLIHTRLAEIHARNLDSKQLNNPNIILDIVSGVWMKCDIIDSLWKVIKA